MDSSMGRVQEDILEPEGRTAEEGTVPGCRRTREDLGVLLGPIRQRWEGSIHSLDRLRVVVVAGHAFQVALMLQDDQVAQVDPVVPKDRVPNCQILSVVTSCAR